MPPPPHTRASNSITSAILSASYSLILPRLRLRTVTSCLPLTHSSSLASALCAKMRASPLHLMQSNAPLMQSNAPLSTWCPTCVRVCLSCYLSRWQATGLPPTWFVSVDMSCPFLQPVLASTARKSDTRKSAPLLSILSALVSRASRYSV